MHGGSNAAAVRLAWDAVGVYPPPPPNDPIQLTDDVTKGDQDATLGNIQPYTLDTGAGHTVTCATSGGSDGDADLYLRFGAEAEVNPNSTINECGSFSWTSNESCTTGAAPSNDTLYAAVHAYSSYTDLTITCTISDAPICTLSGEGESCRTGADCCSGSCSGGKPSRRVCLS